MITLFYFYNTFKQQTMRVLNQLFLIPYNINNKNKNEIIFTININYENLLLQVCNYLNIYYITCAG